MRAFSEIINESPGNTQNYIGTRQLAPKHEYLAKILRHFSSVNAHWLLTGEGEPFRTDTNHSTAQSGNFNVTGHGNKQSIKGNHGNVIGTNTGTATQTNISLDGCKQALALAERDVEHLRAQLNMKDELLASKDETINALRGGPSRPS